jgi:transcriptional regulator NrdR family protein
MNCPKCGTGTRVLDTRHTKRRRVCANNHVFWTDELVISEPQTRRDVKAEQAQRHNEREHLLGEKVVVIAATLGLTTAGAQSFRYRATRRKTQETT